MTIKIFFILYIASCMGVTAIVALILAAIDMDAQAKPTLWQDDPMESDHDPL